MSNRTVWILNEVEGRDFSAAENFGRLEPLTTGSVHVFNPRRMREQLLERINEVGPDDYLLLNGPLGLGYLAIGMLVRKFGYAKTLVYGTNQHDYQLVLFDKGHTDVAA